jgi:hypothetical protein
MTMLLFWVVTLVDSQADTNVLEKYTVSNFRAVDGALKMETVCFSKTLVSACESTQRHNPEQQHCQVKGQIVHF